MKDADEVYAFVFKGQLALDAVERQLARAAESAKDVSDRISQKMPMDLLDRDFVLGATKMSPVFVAIAAFENSARKFIHDRLLEQVGADWWSTHVSKAIRDDAEKRKKDEEQSRWHGARGSSMIFYTQLKDLVAIINQNFVMFAPYIESVEWARQIFGALERSRNVIMHGGELPMNDVERVAMNIRDWMRQVGA